MRGATGDLAAEILKLHYDRPLASRMGTSARQAALEFDRPRQVKAYYELFRELVASGRKQGS